MNDGPGNVIAIDKSWFIQGPLKRFKRDEGSADSNQSSLLSYIRTRPLRVAIIVKRDVQVSSNLNC